MDNILGFILESLANAGVTAALLAVVGVMCRGQLTHWLNRDLEATKAKHMQELEKQKAGHERELEAYRTSLIAQTEAIKAAQDVRRSMAIAMSTRQAEAMHALQAAYAGRCVQLYTLVRRSPSMSDEARSENVAIWKQYMHEMEAASRTVAPYATPDLLNCIGQIQVEAATATLALYDAQPGPSAEELESFMLRMFELQRNFDLTVRDYVERVQTMRDS